MTFEELQKREADRLANNAISQSFDRKDPYSTNRTLYNPASGDLYVTITDSNGNVRRKVFNLLSDG